MKKQVFIAQLINDEVPANPRIDWDNLGHMICAHRSYNLGDEQSSAPYELGGYEDSDDNFRLWVFSEFMDGHKTCPELLQEWYLWDDCPGSAFFCKDDNKNDTGNINLDSFLPKSFQGAIDKWMEDNLCILPLYLYDHSGITMNTSGFSCGWDSGQVGYIYLTKEKWLKEFDRDFVQEEAAKYLTGEVETYDRYLTGEVYGKVLHRIDDEGFEESPSISIMESTPLYDLYMANYEFSIDEYENTEELDACWGYYGRKYAETCCKEEFPSYCLSEALGDFCENYLIKEVIPVNNGVVNTSRIRVLQATRHKALDILQKIPEELLQFVTVEPFVQAKVAAPNQYRYM